jgi:hypothetical protein
MCPPRPAPWPPAVPGAPFLGDGLLTAQGSPPLPSALTAAFASNDRAVSLDVTSEARDRRRVQLVNRVLRPGGDQARHGLLAAGQDPWDWRHVTGGLTLAPT